MTLRQLAAVVLDTVRQAWSHKVFLGAFINGSVSLALLLWYFRTISARGQYSNLTLLSEVDPRYLDNAFAAKILLGSTAFYAFWSQLFFGLMLMLGLLGLVLQSNRNAFLLVTPVRRSVILTGRFLGCLAIVAPGVLYAMAGVWITAGLQFGVWHPPFLAGIGTTMLALSATLAFMVLLQVAFRSTAVVLGATAALALADVALTQPAVLTQISGSETLAAVVGRLSLVLPHTAEVAQWTAVFVQSGSTGNSIALWSTALCGVVALAAAAALFSRKEY